MHPEKGAGRDSKTQKNLLRGVINELKLNGANDVKNSNHISDSLGDKLDYLAELYSKSMDDEASTAGDDLEKEKEQRTIFQRMASSLGALKDSAKETAKKTGTSAVKGGKGLMGMIGKTLSGALVGGGAILAGAGLLAGGAGMFLKELNNMDVDKIKENVKGLLSIQDDFGGAGEFFKKGGTFTLAMAGIGIGLAVFSAGSTVAGMSQKLLDKFSTNWADGVKENVVTLMSIEKELGGAGAFLGDSATFVLAMTGIAAGLAIFGLGSAVAGVGAGLPDAISKFTSGNSFAQGIKDNVLTLLSISDELGGKVSLLAESTTFYAAMSGIGVGLAVFGMGAGIAGLANGLNNFSNPDWAQSIVNNAVVLLSLKDQLGGKIALLSESGVFLAAMTGIGAGLAVFGVGAGISRFMKEGMGSSIKTNVVELMSISEHVGGDFDLKADKVRIGLGHLGDGLRNFTGGGIGAALTNMGVGIIEFFTPGKSPIEKILAIGDKSEQINKAATGIDRLKIALEKLSGIEFKGGNINIAGMLDDFGHLPRLLDGLANGNPSGEPIEFETRGMNKTIDFRNGILDPSLKVPQINKVMTEVNSALGFGTPRNAAMAPAQSESNANSGGGAGNVNVAQDNSSKTNIVQNAATLVQSEPATNPLDTTVISA